MRGLSMFGLITYLFVTFSYQAIFIVKDIFNTSKSLPEADHWLLLFTLGTLGSYMILYGLRVFEVVLRISPVRLFFLKSNNPDNTLYAILKGYGNSFNQRQYKTSSAVAWITLLIVALYANVLFDTFLPPLTIALLMVVFATYLPQQPVVVHP